MLFEEDRYFDYKFPEPQYLGAKYVHRCWIKQFIPDDVQTAIDAFSGSQSIAYMFKQMGLQTYTNDFLKFNHQIGLALIENKAETLTAEDVDILFSPNSDAEKYNLCETLFSNVFFEQSEAQFIDAFRSNVSRLGNVYKQALALAVMNRSLTRKVTMGHFAHTKALDYAADPERVKRNRSLVRPIREIFSELLTDYNAAVFDNQCDNKSYNENILDLLPSLHADLVYFDPPYCDSHSDYQGFYHLLETYTEYWKDKTFVNGVKRYEPRRYSGFEKKTDILQSFEELFSKATHIPYWLVSYNDRSFPDIDTLVAMISKCRHVSIQRKPYANGRGGKGSVAGSNEILLVCK